MIGQIFINKISTKIKVGLKKLYIFMFRKSIFIYRYLDCKININLEKDVDKRIYLYGFEEEVIKQFIKVTKKDDFIFDIGANIGIYSLIASKKIGGSGRVYAFEPAPVAYSSLKKNIELNNFNNIVVIQKGISDKSGEAIFNICDDDAYNSLGETPMKGISRKEIIEIESIDEFVKRNNILKVDIIKIDTEGAEFLILKGAEETLRIYKPKIFFEHNPYATVGFDNTPEDTLIFLKLLGYKLFEFDNDNLKEIIEINNIKGYDIYAEFNEKTTC